MKYYARINNNEIECVYNDVDDIKYIFESDGETFRPDVELLTSEVRAGMLGGKKYHKVDGKIVEDAAATEARANQKAEAENNRQKQIEYDKARQELIDNLLGGDLVALKTLRDDPAKTVEDVRSYPGL